MCYSNSWPVKIVKLENIKRGFWIGCLSSSSCKRPVIDQCSVILLHSFKGSWLLWKIFRERQDVLWLWRRLKKVVTAIDQSALRGIVSAIVLIPSAQKSANALTARTVKIAKKGRLFSHSKNAQFFHKADRCSHDHVIRYSGSRSSLESKKRKTPVNLPSSNRGIPFNRSVQHYKQAQALCSQHLTKNVVLAVPLI